MPDFELAPGRIVHVTDPSSFQNCRPAMVVRDWGGGMFNGVLFVDGYNDTPSGDGSEPELTRWVTSVQHASLGDTGVAWHSHLECSSLHNTGAIT